MKDMNQKQRKRVEKTARVLFMDMMRIGEFAPCCAARLACECAIALEEELECRREGIMSSCAAEAEDEQGSHH